MGRVYEGIDTLTNSRIALKVLHDDVARDEVSLERFKREYEISRLLPHDHIVSVLDFQCDGDRTRGCSSWSTLMAKSFVVFSSVTESSRRIVSFESCHKWRLARRGKFAQFHSSGPQAGQHIPLRHTRGDVVKLLDFGSVKDQSGHRKKLTMLGTTIGSPYYMSPEQAQGLDSIDARADVLRWGRDL